MTRIIMIFNKIFQLVCVRDAKGLTLLLTKLLKWSRNILQKAAAKRTPAQPDPAQDLNQDDNFNAG
jgi:hypothetical protein